MKNFFVLLMLIVVVSGVGCALTAKTSNGGLSYNAPLSESAWIRNGEPVEFEGDVWYPTDEVERLLDGEMFVIGTLRDTLFFAERTDVKPYDRLYTLFGPNRYRAFEKKP